MQETRVQSLGEEDALEKDMATHSSTLAWETPWTEEPGRLQSMQSQVRYDLAHGDLERLVKWACRASRAVGRSQPLLDHWQW